MIKLTRTLRLLLTMAGATVSVYASDKPLVVGFAQTGSENDWSLASTNSLKAEAAARGITLKYVDGQGKAANQVAALESFIAEKADVIVLAPIEETGWEGILGKARGVGIPVILIDRSIRSSDTSEDLWTAFVGSDFLKEGRMAAEWLVAHAGERTRIVELQGGAGSSAAQGRRRGFIEVASKSGKLKVLESVVADFRRDRGKEKMAELIKKHGREIQILYSHNDAMTFGAIEAIEEAGLVPGKDIMIVSFDAMKDAVKGVIEGKINCTVECNPLFGPPVMDIVDKITKGQKVRRISYNTDQVIDASNAAALLPTRKY